jgi:hypothetical protein
MKQPRIPTDYPRISIESLETKKKLIEIGILKGETMKETIIRLVDQEYKRKFRRD